MEKPWAGLFTGSIRKLLMKAILAVTLLCVCMGFGITLRELEACSTKGDVLRVKLKASRGAYLRERQLRLKLQAPYLEKYHRRHKLDGLRKKQIAQHWQEIIVMIEDGTIWIPKIKPQTLAVDYEDYLKIEGQ